MIQDDLFGAPPPAPPGTTMPALTLWQPWASCIFAPVACGGFAKTHETRSWEIPARLYGRRIAIHAAATLPSPRHVGPALDALCIRLFGAEWRNTLPMGAVIGTCVASGNIRTETLRDRISPEDLACGIWDDGRWAWRLSSIDHFAVPIPAAGAQGFWNWRTPSDGG